MMETQGLLVCTHNPTHLPNALRKIPTCKIDNNILQRKEGMQPTNPPNLKWIPDFQISFFPTPGPKKKKHFKLTYFQFEYRGLGN
jgi:hypothetical protein